MSTQRRRYASPRQIARRGAILAATREMLSKVGYEGTTMRSVAERAEVAKGTIYNLFGSKDELILAALIDLLDQIAERVRESAASPGLESLLTVARLTCEQVESTPQYADAMARALFRAGPGDPLIGPLLDSTARFNAAQLDLERRRGRIAKDVDCDRLGLQIESQKWGIVLIWMLGSIPLESVSTETLRGTLSSLAAAAEPKTRRELLERLRQL